MCQVPVELLILGIPVAVYSLQEAQRSDLIKIVCGNLIRDGEAQLARDRITWPALRIQWLDCIGQHMNQRARSYNRDLALQKQARQQEDAHFPDMFGQAGEGEVQFVDND